MQLLALSRCVPKRELCSLRQYPMLSIFCQIRTSNIFKNNAEFSGEGKWNAGGMFTIETQYTYERMWLPALHLNNNTRQEVGSREGAPLSLCGLPSLLCPSASFRGFLLALSLWHCTLKGSAGHSLRVLLPPP